MGLNSDVVNEESWRRPCPPAIPNFCEKERKMPAKRKSAKRAKKLSKSKKLAAQKSLTRVGHPTH